MEEWIEQCREKCRRIKYIRGPLEWREKPSRSDTLRATSFLLDHNYVTIQGLKLQAEYSVRKRTGYEVVTYGLFQYIQGEWLRVFFFCLWPKGIRSHRDNKSGKVYFGPHLHLGDERRDHIARELRSGIESVLDPQWIVRFRRHTRLNDTDCGVLEPPVHGDLFGGT